MPKQRRIFDKEFNLPLQAEVEAGTPVMHVARAHGVHHETIRKRRKLQAKYGERSFAGRGCEYTDEARISQLERTLGQMAAEKAPLKKAIRTLQELDRGVSVARRSRK